MKRLFAALLAALVCPSMLSCRAFFNKRPSETTEKVTVTTVVPETTVTEAEEVETYSFEEYASLYYDAVAAKDGMALYGLISDKCNYAYMIAAGCENEAAVIDCYDNFYFFNLLEARYGEEYEILSYEVISDEAANDYRTCGVEAISTYLCNMYGYADGYVSDVVFLNTNLLISANGEEHQHSDDLVMLYIAEEEKWYISDILPDIEFARDIIDLYYSGEFDKYYGNDSGKYLF